MKTVINKRLYYFLFLFVFNCTSKTSAKPDYDIFQKEWNAKNYERSLEIISELHKSQPDVAAYTLRYAENLYILEKYKKAIKIYNKVPEKFNHYWVQHKLANAFLKIGQPQKTLEILVRAIKRPEYNKTKRNIYWDLLYLAPEINGIETARKLQSEIISSFKDPNDTLLLSCKSRMVQIYRTKALIFLTENQLDKALDYYNYLLEIEEAEYKNNNPKIELQRLGTDRVYRDAINFFIKNPPQKSYKIKVRHKALVTVFNEVKLNFKNKQNKQIKINQKIERANIKTFERNIKLLQMFYYYISNGQLLIEYKFEKIDTQLITEFEQKSLKNGLLSAETPWLDPDKTDYISGKYREYDTFFRVFPIPVVEGYASNFSAYFLIEEDNKKKPRAMIQIGCFRNSPGNWIHEFFHTIEKIYRIKDKHLYYESNRSRWPEWYNGTGGDDFYRLSFIHNNLINRIEEIPRWFRD